jgi:hypothetical protein
VSEGFEDSGADLPGGGTVLPTRFQHRAGNWSRRSYLSQTFAAHRPEQGRAVAGPSSAVSAGGFETGLVAAGLPKARNGRATSGRQLSGRHARLGRRLRRRNLDERPIVRGWSRARSVDGEKWTQIAREDGLAEITFATDGRPLGGAPGFIDPPRAVGMMVWVLDALQALRSAADAPAAEFVLDWEMVARGPTPKLLGTLNSSPTWSPRGAEDHLPERVPFPRLSIGMDPDYAELLGVMIQDLLSAGGDDHRLGDLEIERG